MGVVLRSKLVWSVMGVLFVMSLHRMAMRQLARDPRFLALPQEVTIAAPKWGGDEVVVHGLAPRSFSQPRRLELLHAFGSEHSVHRRVSASEPAKVSETLTVPVVRRWLNVG